MIQLTIFGIINLVLSVEKDKSLFSSRNKGSLSSFKRYEHHITVVGLGRIDGISCKDPLTEAYLPITKAVLQCLPPQRDEHTKFGGQSKTHRPDLAKNVIVLLWVNDPGHEQDNLCQEPKVILIPLFKKIKNKISKSKDKIAPKIHGLTH